MDNKNLIYNYRYCVDDETSGLAKLVHSWQSIHAPLRPVGHLPLVRGGFILKSMFTKFYMIANKNKILPLLAKREYLYPSRIEQE
jgi:hypothetical protein